MNRKRLKAHRDSYYNALRALYPSEYTRAINHASARAIDSRMELRDAAELEWAFVAFACELLGVQP